VGYVCGKFIKIEGYGTTAPFGQVLVVPSLFVPMALSAAQITNMGHSNRFEKDKVTITNSGGDCLLEGYRDASNLYTVDTYSNTTDK